MFVIYVCWISYEYGVYIYMYKGGHFVDDFCINICEWEHFCYWGTNWECVSIGSGNALGLMSRQLNAYVDVE